MQSVRGNILNTYGGMMFFQNDEPPTAQKVVEKTVWFQPSSRCIRLWTATGWQEFMAIYVQETAPEVSQRITNKTVWFDISSSERTIKYWDGTAWQPFIAVFA